MSGATVVRQRGARYELELSTPSISFPVEPPHPGPTAEQRYHADAARRLGAALAPFDGPLDRALAGIPELIAYDPELPPVASHREPGPGPCRWTFPVGAPPVSPAWPGGGAITVALATWPDDATRARVADAVGSAIAAILVAHHREARARRRRDPPGAEPRFHYTRTAAGAVDDHTGAAPGQPPTATADPLALCEAIAAIITIAEADGVVHRDLGPEHVRVVGDPVPGSGDDEPALAGAVSLDGFGVVEGERPRRAPDGDPALHGGGRPVDWLAYQRFRLGATCYRLLASVELDVPPGTGRRAHAAAVARALAALDAPASVRTALAAALDPAPARRPPARALWDALTARHPRPPPPPARATAGHLAARRAAGARGLLEPCVACGRPALAGAGRDVRTATGLRPDCCFRARADRVTRAILAGLALAAAAGIALALRWLAT